MSRYKVLQDRSLVRDVRRRVPMGDGNGYTSVSDGKEEFFFNVSLDMQGIDVMARHAASNKSGSAKQGPLFVTITSRRRA